MSVNCTRCEGTGFLNADHFPEFVDDELESRLGWIEFQKKIYRTLPECFCENTHPSCRPCAYCEIASDVQVCDCCGDGENWYGEPGEHYNNDDPPGKNGPYASNGGLCQCH